MDLFWHTHLGHSGAYAADCMTQARAGPPSRRSAHASVAETLPPVALRSALRGPRPAARFTFDADVSVNPPASLFDSAPPPDAHSSGPLSDTTTA